MNTYFVIIIIVILLLFFTTKKTLERFESGTSEDYFMIKTKLNNKVVQPYKGTIDSSLTMNERRENYYPQLWSYKDNYVKSVYNNKYLTISDDGNKVELVTLDSKRQQKWKMTKEGFIVNLNKESQALTIEGSNTSEDAMVVIDKPLDKPSFKWELSKIEIEIKRIEIIKKEISGLVEKQVSGSSITDSNGFSYSFWFIVNSDLDRNKWRNIFLRGTKDGSQRTPGIWIVANKNKLHVRASTDKNANEGIIESKFTFDLQTWYYISYVISENKLQLFVNGQISEEFTLSGSPIHTGDLFIGNNGGFDGKIASLVYINKPLVSNEIISDMKQSNPDKDCEEQRETTIISNNVLKGINEWKITGGEKIKNNKECPPTKLGGPTVSFSIKKESNIEVVSELLENQYYDVSIWGLASKEVNIRPISGNWKGEWRLVKKDWKELNWEFLNVEKSNDFSFEFNSENTNTTSISLFLPVLKVKLLRVEDGNIQVKEYRSNGTHPTCSVKEVGLNNLSGWCALKDVREKYYIEATFDKLYQIQKIHTRGRGDYPQWTTEYKIEYYDVYYSSWKSYANGVVLTGNKDMNSVKTNDINIVTKKIRIYPVSYHSWPSLRIGFSGIITVRDKCMEYKTKSEIEQNILEREKYLKLYHRECKKISFYQHELELEREKKLLEEVEKKLNKSQINAKTYESKYNQSTNKINELQKEVQKLNLEKEIIGGNNRDMDKSTKLNEKCEVVKEKKISENKQKEKATGNKEKEKPGGENKKTKEEMLEELLEKMDKVTKDLDVKQTKLEKIESELKLLDNKSISTNKNKEEKKLVDTKKLTEKEITDLQKQLKTCQSNFEGNNSVVETFVSNDSSKQKVIPCSLGKYDIRKHTQYNKLISDIQKKMKSEYKCEKKEVQQECTPFNTMDIKRHKDYPKVIEAVYTIAKNEFSDIRKHRDFRKTVHEVQNRTIQSYGRKTPYGYTKCPTECELFNEVDIKKHPKFRSIIREVVRKVISKYGQPIPGTNPILYRPCSEKIVSSNIKDMNTDKCMQSFNFAGVESFQNYSSSANAELFDIRNHRQYPEIIKSLEEKKCSDSVLNSKMEELKKQCEAKIRDLQKSTREDVTKSEQYLKLLKAYEKLIKEQNTSKSSGGINFDELQEAYQKLKKEYEAIKLNSAIGTFDINKHPDIDRYVLKSSLPIDLNIKKLYDEQIVLLKSELAKLQSVHGKCTNRFNLPNVEGFTSSNDTNEAIVLVEKINKLIAKLDKNMTIEDKSQFEEIKNACRNAFNFVGYMDDKSRKFVENVYRDILAVQAKEKKLEELLRTHLKHAQSTTPQNEISKMIQLESKKQANEKQIISKKIELDAMKNSLEKSTSETKDTLLVKSKEAIDDVSNKLNNNAIKNPRQEANNLRSIRKELESNKDNLDVNIDDLKKKYNKLKAVVQDYEFKNKYIRDELSLLRKRCNERIIKLWEENGNIRKSLEDRESKNKNRELNLNRKEKELEEREEKISTLRSSQLEKYNHYQNKLQDERSVTDKYKAELERLRDNLENEKGVWDSKRIELENQVSMVRDDCSNRVDRYRRMYEEGEKLLDELRVRSLKAPSLVEKIDKVSNKMAKTVDSAIHKTEELKASKTPTKVHQVSIDNQLLEGMKKLVEKVGRIENKIKSTNSDNTMWYNNTYSVL